MRLMTIPDVMAATAMGRTAVWRLIREGRLSHHRIGRSVRVSEDDLQAFLEAVRVAAANAPIALNTHRRPKPPNRDEPPAPMYG